MTATAGRNNLHISRRMPLMTIQAELPVGLAHALQGKDNTFMTFDAIPTADTRTNGPALFCLGCPKLRKLHVYKATYAEHDKEISNIFQIHQL